MGLGRRRSSSRSRFIQVSSTIHFFLFFHDVFDSANWEVRHGAALALREVIRVQGAAGGVQSTSRVSIMLVPAADVQLVTSILQKKPPRKRTHSSTQNGRTTSLLSSSASSYLTDSATLSLIKSSPPCGKPPRKRSRRFCCTWLPRASRLSTTTYCR